VSTTIFALLLLGRTTSTVRLTLLERDGVVLVLKLNLTEPLFPLDVVFVRLDSKALVFPGVLFLLEFNLFTLRAAKEDRLFTVLLNWGCVLIILRLKVALFVGRVTLDDCLLLVTVLFFGVLTARETDALLRLLMDLPVLALELLLDWAGALETALVLVFCPFDLFELLLLVLANDGAKPRTKIRTINTTTFFWFISVNIIRLLSLAVFLGR